ncbi:DegV family protein [Thermosipho ferrireducens]|uniref:DegV family protein n=1 Tax=Thermosipho ferrireducens TaxID=2571116 RepID=A0ABX7S461_9BACT|nr:DegV family protein [Thermosipho ferrireducens]QTA37167.1 DegV family protein [Thermosipho ferrireducens]
MVAFVVDSSCDIPTTNLKYPVYSIPLRVFLDGAEYKDKVDINVNTFYKKIETAKDFATSLPNPKEAEELIKKLYKEYDHIYVLSISSRLSGTYNMLKSICEPMSDKVTVLDSKTASVEIYCILKRLFDEVDSGNVITQEIVDKHKNNSMLIFAVGTLEYLEKGGRIGKAKALLGKLLRIKPILTVDEEGEVASIGMARKMTSVVDKIIEIAEKFIKEHKIEKPYFVSGYGGEVVKEYIQKIQKYFGIKDIARIGPSIGVHTGPKVFGIVVSK